MSFRLTTPCEVGAICPGLRVPESEAPRREVTCSLCSKLVA